MLEEQLSVSPEGVNCVGAGNNPADQAILATELGCDVEAEDLEECSVGWEDRHLILHVILVRISPAIDIVWLDVYLIGPVGILLLIAVLVKEGHVHD